MIRKIMFMLLLLMAVTLAGMPQALATPTYKSWFEANYSAAVNSRIDVCLLCHVDPNPISFENSDRNQYGADFGRNGHNFAAIEPLDSDGDGFINIDEIHNLTFPGNASDFPSTAAPPSNVTVIPTFNISGFKTNNATGSGVQGWNVTLINSTMHKSMMTGADGSYKFTNLINGTYNVTEEMQMGWTNVSPMSQRVTVAGSDVININFTNQPLSNVTPSNATPSVTPSVTPSNVPTEGIMSFILGPNLNTTLKGMPINITITVTSGNASQMPFSGMADINITANNVSAVSSPMNVSFINGSATIQITSSVAQFVTVTATSVTGINNSISGSTQIMFADKIFSLSKGWNLISIPNLVDQSSINQTLWNVQNNGVVGFDPSTGNFTTPTDLEPLFGYWINVTADNQSLGFIASTKIPSMPPTRWLYGGWNLIGVSASRNDPDTLSISQLFVDLKQGPDFTQWLYTRLVSFDQPAAPFTLVAGTDLSDLTFLKQGHGYWLFIKNLQNNNTNNVPWAGKQW